MQPKVKEPLNLRKTCERKLLRGIAKKSSSSPDLNIPYRRKLSLAKQSVVCSQKQTRTEKNIIVKQNDVCFVHFIAIQSHIRLWAPVSYQKNTIFHIKFDSDWDHPKGMSWRSDIDHCMMQWSAPSCCCCNWSNWACAASAICASVPSKHQQHEMRYGDFVGKKSPSFLGGNPMSPQPQ